MYISHFILIPTAIGLYLSNRESSGSVVECLAAGFEPHLFHCIVVLEQDTFILA